jgi:hypothetical protein
VPEPVERKAIVFSCIAAIPKASDPSHVAV